MKGGIRDIIVESDSEDESDEEVENSKSQMQKKTNSMFSMFK